MAVFFAGTTLLTDNLVEWKAAGIPLEIAKVEATREAHTVDVNAATAIDLAEIHADTTKKTDGSFILFWAIRAGMWIAGGLACLYVLLLVLMGGARE